MGDNTGIEWTDATWNWVTGCDKVSPGCDHCYADTIATRFAGTKAYPKGFAVTLRPHRTTQPLRWQRPRRIFVNSMSDVFHNEISDADIARMWAVMAIAQQHTFQILTKRHGRMRSLLSKADGSFIYNGLLSMFMDNTITLPKKGRLHDQVQAALNRHAFGQGWPLPNVHLGVSVENQKYADLRIPALLDIPAATRFISAEPLLGPIDLAAAVAHWVPPHDHPAWGEPRRTKPGTVESRLHTRSVLHWVIVGGESGPGARPMDPQWARGLRDQCQKAEIAFLFKQWGEWAPTGTHAYGQLDNGDIYGSATQEFAPGVLAHEVLKRVGKKSAGRELDGRTWDEYPQPSAPVAPTPVGVFSDKLANGPW